MNQITLATLPLATPEEVFEQVSECLESLLNPYGD